MTTEATANQENQIDRLSAMMSRTVEVDPEALKLEHTIDSYEKTLRAATPGSPEEKVISETLESLARQLAEYRESVADDPPPPLITIGYIRAEDLTELDLMEEAAISLDDAMARRRAMVEIDRHAVTLGVRGHAGMLWDGEIVEFEVVKNIVDYYERRRWLRPLRWAIYRMNTLTEKKSVS